MKKQNKILIIIIFVLLVIFKAFFFSKKYPEDKYISNTLVYIESLKSISEGAVRYNVRLNVGGNKYNFKDKFILKIYLNEETTLEEWNEYTSYTNGDVIKINGKIQIPEYMNNPGEFNYKHYLYSNNIYGEIVVSKTIEKVEYKLNIKEKLLNYIYRYKEYLGNKLDENMDEKYSSVAKSIIYGDSLDIDENTNDSFKKAGVSHMMAISGSNIIGLTTVLLALFKLCKINKKFGKILSGTVVIIYVILVGTSLSTLRAGIMCIICTYEEILISERRKKNSSLKKLLITIGIILFYVPFSIYNVGFILSCLATIGIILFNPYCASIKCKILSKVSNKVAKKILDVFLTNMFLSLSVQILILPVQINSFNIISLTSILSNVFCSLISSEITVFGSIYLLFSYIPVLSNILIFILNICISCLMFGISIFKSIAIELKIMDLSIFSIILWYISVFLLYIKIYLKRIFYGRRLAFKKYTITQIIVATFFILITIFSNIYFKCIDSFVYFFNVGQGELSLIKSKENMVIVDIGSLKVTQAYNALNGYFKMKNVAKVDAIILSHMHSDHINGLENFVKEYKVGKIIYAEPFYENEEYINFLKIIEKYKLNTQVVRSGEKVKYGDIHIEILLPDIKELKDKEDENNLNTNSVVCKISIKDKDVLYMGDATTKTEERLLEKYKGNNEIFKDIEILKVAHHGSKTSSCEEYIERIKPKYAVISAKKKYYNHPHESVIETLNKYNVQIYITENLGAIKFNLYNL